MKRRPQLNSVETLANTNAFMLMAPILPEKAEAWRRFMQELSGSRQQEYEASRRRLGICTERAWISETRGRAIGILLIGANYLEQTLVALATSNDPFDCWFREQMLRLQAFDPARPNRAFLPDLVFAWRDEQKKGDEQR